MDVRFRGKSGRAADITSMTHFDPTADIGPIPIPQCSNARQIAARISASRRKKPQDRASASRRR